jgi:hypothetical protein
LERQYQGSKEQQLYSELEIEVKPTMRPISIRLDDNQNKHWNGDPFPLACRTAGEILGITKDYANNLLSLLTKEGFLEVTKGNTVKANRYRLNSEFRK